jgi:MoxR-like ATPase
MSTPTDVHDLAKRLIAGLDLVIIGQGEPKEALVACLLAGGHALIEGVPGTGKTLLALALSRLAGCGFRRIQFTPDLMPIDLLGTNILDQRKGEFTFMPGPVFSEVLLADEINRTPPRTQSALLEAMQERAVTIDGVRRALPRPFFVVATQNPVEFEGTYPLPEAQRDRFLVRVAIGYPAPDDEIGVLRAYAEGRPLHEAVLEGLAPITDPAGIVAAQLAISTGVRVEDRLLRYIRELVAATRTDQSVQLGAGPRAGLAILAIGRALAALRGRDFLIPDDIKAAAPMVLSHRLVLAAESEMEGGTVGETISRILAAVEIPR